MVWPTVQDGAHRDELGLHAPAGRVFRIVEAARQRDPLGRPAAARRISVCSSFGRSSRMATASSESSSRTPSATVSGGSSSRISSRTVSSTSVSAVKSKSCPISSTRRGRSSGSSASIRSPTSASCRSPTSSRSSRRHRPPRSPAPTRSTKSSRSAPSSPRNATGAGAAVMSFSSSMPSLVATMGGMSSGLYARRFWAGNRQRRRCLRWLWLRPRSNAANDLSDATGKTRIVPCLFAACAQRGCGCGAGALPGNADALRHRALKRECVRASIFCSGATRSRPRELARREFE